MNLKLFSILVIVFFVSFSFYTAQSKIHENKYIEKEDILLKSRHIAPDRETATTSAIEADSEKKAHILIQLNHIPDSEERRLLAANGITLLDYIPNKAWLASVNNQGMRILSQHSSVSYIGPILPEDKISPGLRKNAAPWTRNTDGTLNLTVLFFDDVPLEKATQIIEGFGAVLESQDNIFTARIPENMVSILVSEDEVKWIEAAPPQPITLNDGSRAALSVDTINAAPFNLNGTGVVAAEWDEGWAEQTHDGLSGRVTRGDSGNSDAFHSTHVAGTVLGNGAGGNELYRGMAPNSTLITYEWWNTLTELNNEYTTAINTYSAVVSQNSWGILNFPQCTLLGDYETGTQRIDDVTRGLLGERILTVWAVGNERSSGKCGPQLGIEFNTTIPYSTAKNALSVGAVNSNDNSITSFTSWGPTDDGRLKPEIVAPGCENELIRNDNDPTKTIWSTKTGNGYGGACGTSMAAPAVSGVAVLVYEDWRNQTGGSNPFPSTAKALLIHTADDLNDTGPDYRTGYGLVNATKAIQKIRDENTLDVIIEGNVSDGENDTYQLIISGESEIKFTLVWDDYPAAPLADPTLVNNLDLIVTNSSGSRFYPWTLDSSNPSSPAVQTSADNINNVEQVVVSSPNNGTWTVTVNGTSVPQGQQTYSLISSNSFDITPPNIAFVFPTPSNETVLDENFAFINVSISEPASTLLLEWNSTNETMSNSSQTNWLLNKTNLYDAVYTYRVYATDLAGLTNVSENRTLEIYLLSVESPQNKSFNNATLDFNITVNKTLNNALFSVDGGSNNTMGNDSSVHYFNTSFPPLSEGFHDVSFWVNDTQGNTNSKTIFFTVDLTPPNWSDNSTALVSIYDPVNLSFFNITWLDNFQIDSAWVEGNWTGSNKNFTMFTENGSVYQYNTSLPAGTFFWRYWSNDTAGNVNMSNLEVSSIGKLPTNITLLINGNSSNSSFDVGDTVNLTAILNTTGNVSLFINGTSASNGSSPLEFLWDTAHKALGIYNITGSLPEDQNHTGSSQSLNLTLNDTAAPNITIPGLFPPLILLGEVVNISANVTDFGTIDSVVVNVSNSSFSTTESMTNISDSYNIGFNTTNLAIGIYDATVIANDTEGNTMNLSAGSFEISQKINITINTLSNQNDSTNVTKIEIFYNGSNSIRNSSENASSLTYDALPRGLWDIRISTAEFNVTLNVNISDNVTANINIDGNISASSLTLPPGITKFSKTVATETTLNFTTTALMIPYNESDVNESYIDVMACHTWNLTSRTCTNDNWANITSSSIDTENNTVSLNTQELSSFSVSQSVFCGDNICSEGEACSSCSADCGTCSPVTTDSDGGAGSGETSVCIAGERLCSGDDIVECNQQETALSIIESCQYGCSNGICNPTPQICQPNEITCSGDALQQCNSAGTSFELIEECSFGCSEGACNPEPKETDETFVVRVGIILIIIVISIGIFIVHSVLKRD